MRAQAHHEKGGGEMTHGIVMIETLEHPHLIPLDFLPQNSLQYNLARDIARCRLGGISRGREGDGAG